MEKLKNLQQIENDEWSKLRVENLSRKWLLPVLLCLSDYLSILTALLGAYYIRENCFAFLGKSLFISETFIYFVIPAAFLLFLHYDRLYTRGLPFWQQVEKIVKASTYAILFVIVLMYMTGSVAEISRVFMALSWGLSCMILSLSRLVMQYIFASCSFLQAPVLVFGAGKTLGLMLTAIKGKEHLGYRIVGILEDEIATGQNFQGYPIVGRFDEAEEIIKRSKVQDVLITAPGLTREELTTLVYKIQPLVENITFVPDLFGIPVRGIEVESLFDEKVVLLKVCNNLSKKYNLAIKRCSDILFSLLLLPVILPIMFFISVFIYTDSKGPVFHKASRLGQNGRVFCCYKFRTMHENHQAMFNDFLQKNPQAKQEWKLYAKIKKGDPRVTRMGQILRRYSLDELPQIINVILGDMSLVGPRPYLPRERHMMQYYREVIHKARPGITGLWQVSGRNQLSFEQRLHLDAWYVRNWSVWLDFVMLCKTVRVVLLKKGAY